MKSFNISISQEKLLISIVYVYVAKSYFVFIIIIIQIMKMIRQNAWLCKKKDIV